MSASLATALQRPRHLGPLLCWAVVFADVGSSVYYVPGLLYNQRGVGTLAAAFVSLVAVAGLLLAFKYAEIAWRYPGGGGVVSVASAAFGPTIGCLGGVLICTDYFLAASIGVLAGVAYLGSVVSRPGLTLPLACMALVVLGLLNLAGVRRSAIVSLVMGGLAFVTQLVVVIVTASRLTAAEWATLGSRFGAVTQASGPQLLAGFGAAWLAFSGLEALSQISGSLARPRRRVANVAMGLVFGSVVITAPLLTAFSTITLAGRATVVPRSDRFISELAGWFGGDPLQAAVALSAAALLIFSANTAILGCYHVLLALVRQGFLPPRLAARSRSLATPHFAIGVATLVPVLVLLLTRGVIDLLGQLYAFGLLGAFVLSSIGLDCVRWREGQRGPAFWVGVVTSAAIVVAWLTNLCTKPLATLFGGGLTVTVMLIAVGSRNGWRAGASGAAAGIEFGLRALGAWVGRLLRDVVAWYDRRVSVPDGAAGARPGDRGVDARRLSPRDRARAIAACTRALEESPLDATLVAELARLWLAERDASRAAAVLRTTLARQPGEAEIHYLLGLALLRGGDTEAALASLRAAVTLEPRHGRAQRCLAAQLIGHGRLDEAAAALEAALSQVPDHPTAHRSLGLIYACLGRRREAAAHLAAAVELRQRDAVS
ncbi:MAG: amino acid permease [Deltaproteobacteria bacterium]|nr:amino acid permease [Deltaproteobacteria bacterium]